MAQPLRVLPRGHLLSKRAPQKSSPHGKCPAWPFSGGRHMRRCGVRLAPHKTGRSGAARVSRHIWGGLLRKVGQFARTGAGHFVRYRRYSAKAQVRGLPTLEPRTATPQFARTVVGHFVRGSHLCQEDASKSPHQPPQQGTPQGRTLRRQPGAANVRVCVAKSNASQRQTDGKYS